MSTIDVLKENNMSRIRAEIKSNIFVDIRNRRLFGTRCLWQFYMVRDFYSKYPKELEEQIDIVINRLKNEHIFEQNNYDYKLTSEGEALIYESDIYSIDTTIEKILKYLRENNYYENSRWPILTAMSFSDKLNVYEERLFKAAIDKMLEYKLFDYDDIHNSYIVTHKCQQKMFGLDNEDEQ